MARLGLPTLMRQRRLSTEIWKFEVTMLTDGHSPGSRLYVKLRGCRAGIFAWQFGLPFPALTSRECSNKPSFVCCYGMEI